MFDISSYEINETIGTISVTDSRGARVKSRIVTNATRVRISVRDVFPLVRKWREKTVRRRLGSTGSRRGAWNA